MNELGVIIEESLRKNEYSYLDSELQQRALSETPCYQVDIGNGVSLCRFDSLSEAYPYFDQILALINRNLPPQNNRLKMSDIAEETHTYSDGKVIDIREYWKGATFGILQDDTIKGISLARREVVMNGSGEGEFTGRGSMPYFVTDPSFFGRAALFLGLCSFEALVDNGCTEVRGSCAITNTRVDSLYTKISMQRWVEGEWVRYVYDPDKIKEVAKTIIPRLGLTEHLNAVRASTKSTQH